MSPVSDKTVVERGSFVAFLVLAEEGGVDRTSGALQAALHQMVLASESFGPLTAELRRAESNHHDVNRILPTLVKRRSLDDAENIGAVLISRLQKAAQPKHGKHHSSPQLVVGLIPVADGAMNEIMAEALTQRAELMEERAMTLAEKAVKDQAPWLKRLGAPPTPVDARRHWLQEVRTVAGRCVPRPVPRGRAQDSWRTQERRAEARCCPC